MWCWPVRVLLLVQLVFTQPLTDDEKSARHLRQLDFGECCPCPDNEDQFSFRNQGHWSNSIGRNKESGNAGRFSTGTSRAAGFDDCPCRQRGADSEGSSSIFFPSAMRPTGSLSTLVDSKEDPKNLLEPEVGLASSVLETLRDATDEEYREALARDAARSRATEDAIPEESAQNIVTIILPSGSDEEDMTRISETLHIQEPRCTHPLGRSLSKMRTPVAKSPILTEILRMPKIKNGRILHKDSLVLDSSVGASNVLEDKINMNGRKEMLKATPALLKPSIDEVCESGFKKETNFKSVPLLEKKSESPEGINAIKNSNNAKVLVNLRSSDEMNCNIDMRSAASDMKEFITEKSNPGLKLESLLSQNSPLNLKNLLKLRDVEFIPPGQLIEKLKLGQHTVPSFIENMPKLNDFLKNGIKLDFDVNKKWNNVKTDDKSLEHDNSNTNIQVIPRKITTSIHDALASTSNINEVKDNCQIGYETKTMPASEDVTIKTDIIEHLPNSFHSVEDDDHVVKDIDLGQVVKSAEDDSCELSRYKNEDMTKDKVVSMPSELIPNTENKANLKTSIPSKIIAKNLEENDGFETAHDDQVSTKNSIETIQQDDNTSNSHIKTINLIDERPRFENENLKNVVDNSGKINRINNRKESSLSKSLASIRESILKKIDARKISSKLNEGDKLRQSNVDRENNKNLDVDCDIEPSENMLSVASKLLDTTSKNMKSSEDVDPVQFDDLQKLSDSLLEQSLLQEKLAPKIESTDSGKGAETELNSTEDNADKILNYSREIMNDTDTTSSNRHATKMTNAPIPENENACLASRDEGISEKILSDGPDVNEMAAEASEVGTQWHDPLQLYKDTSLGLPLFQNIIVQPSSLFEGIQNPPSIDLEGALKLPTLDDIRQGLANPFGRHNEDTAEDMNCSDQNIMSVEPSISNFISKTPLIPLEDLNLDIFQFKPLNTGKFNTLTNMPELNLKSFRTKVPVPKKLDLKPLKLESTIGNEGGLLGASLTFGQDTVGTPFESLGKPLLNIPSLDEMVTRVKTNVESFVSPLDSSSVNSIPKLSDLSNSLRADTENTIRALQDRMGSTLGKANNLLNESPKGPQELIERIADAKEDLDAKLKGLRYDLNDRITSLHENILDQTGLSSLNPLIQGTSLSERNIFSSHNTNIGTKRLQTPTSKKMKIGREKEVLGKTANYKNRPTIEKKSNTIGSQRKLKMPASASVPVPKTIEVPKLKSIFHKDPKMINTKPLRLENNLDALPSKTSARPIPEKSILSKQYKEKKVKVTFGSTSPSPISPTRSQQRSNTNFHGVPTEGFRRPDNGLAKKLGIKSRSEPNVLPSEVQTTRMQTPTDEVSRDCNDNFNSLEDSIVNAPLMNEEQGRTMSETLNQKSKPKIPKILDSTRSDFGSRSSNKSPNPLPSWPKVEDDPFLSKVRDALRARLSNFDPKKTAYDNEQRIAPDMERSPSVNAEVIVDENLKENIPYKCTMMCTKL